VSPAMGSPLDCPDPEPDEEDDPPQPASAAAMSAVIPAMAPTFLAMLERLRIF
jgi:hypothetical protein